MYLKRRRAEKKYKRDTVSTKIDRSLGTEVSCEATNVMPSPATFMLNYIGVRTMEQDHSNEQG